MAFRNCTTRQKLIVIVIGIVNFCSAICVSLQAPFYPREAEKKGATATGCGLVFGVFELTVFLVSPILGSNLKRLGVKRTFSAGIFTTGTCCVIFGLLDRIPGANMFIGAGILVRALEAVGNSGFLTSSFSMIASEFPNSVATMFSTQEMCFGLGLILGPTIGSYLYDVGGYTLPFVVMGSVLVLAACMTMFAMPRFDSDPDTLENTGLNPEILNETKANMFTALKVPSIALSAFSIIAAAISIGFLQTSLEPHMRQFNISSMTMGGMFVINGGFYAGTTLMWGTLCDNYIKPKNVSIIGCFLIITGFSILGPAPYIPFDPTFNICIIALIIHGIGFAAMLVAGFADAHKEAIRNGFPDNLSTYGLISGMWTSAFALGAFIGPSVGGALLERYGFSWSSLLVITPSVIALILFVIYNTTSWVRHRKMKDAYILIDDGETTTIDRRRYGSFDSDLSGESGLTRSSTGYSSLKSDLSQPASSESTSDEHEKQRQNNKNRVFKNKKAKPAFIKPPPEYSDSEGTPPDTGSSRIHHQRKMSSAAEDLKAILQNDK